MEWRDIPFANGYLASFDGRVLGLRKTVLNPTETDRGYLVCDLHKKQYRLNRIICLTFHGNPPTFEHQAAHKDSDKRNNWVDNLYWQQH